MPLAQSERTFSGRSVTSSQLVYVHADQLNTPRLATNTSGTVVWRWDSDAFGVGEADTDPDSDTNLVNVRLRFPGQYLDEETGLHYNYFRDHDPVTRATDAEARRDELGAPTEAGLGAQRHLAVVGAAVRGRERRVVRNVTA